MCPKKDSLRFVISASSDVSGSMCSRTYVFLSLGAGASAEPSTNTRFQMNPRFSFLPPSPSNFHIQT